MSKWKFDKTVIAQDIVGQQKSGPIPVIGIQAVNFRVFSKQTMTMHGVRLWPVLCRFIHREFSMHTITDVRSWLLAVPGLACGNGVPER